MSVAARLPELGEVQAAYCPATGINGVARHFGISYKQAYNLVQKAIANPREGGLTRSQVQKRLGHASGGSIWFLVRTGEIERLGENYYTVASVEALLARRAQKRAEQQAPPDCARCAKRRDRMKAALTCANPECHAWRNRQVARIRRQQRYALRQKPAWTQLLEVQRIPLEEGVSIERAAQLPECSTSYVHRLCMWGVLPVAQKRPRLVSLNHICVIRQLRPKAA